MVASRVFTVGGSVELNSDLGAGSSSAKKKPERFGPGFQQIYFPAV